MWVRQTKFNAFAECGQCKMQCGASMHMERAKYTTVDQLYGRVIGCEFLYVVWSSDRSWYPAVTGVGMSDQWKHQRQSYQDFLFGEVCTENAAKIWLVGFQNRESKWQRAKTAQKIGMAELIEITTSILTDAQKGIIRRRALVYKGHRNRWLTLEQGRRSPALIPCQTHTWQQQHRKYK